MPLAHALGGAYLPLQLGVPLVIALAYLRRTRTLAGHGRPVPGLRQAAFFGGLAVVVAAVASPLAELGEELFAVHMVQHIVLGDLAALLIALGITGPVVQPLLRIRVLRHIRTIAHPAIALPLWLVNLYAWHLPVLYQATLSHETVHALEHALFIGLGTNMWLALLGPFPAPAWFGNAARLGYVLIVRFVGAILGNVFIWSGTVFYPRYASGEAEHGVSALRDQGLAGSVMMLESSVLTVALLGWLLFRTMEQGEQRQRLLELADRLGVELSEERAKRAVAAGRGDELRRRLEQTARAEQAVRVGETART